VDGGRRGGDLEPVPPDDGTRLPDYKWRAMISAGRWTEGGVVKGVQGTEKDRQSPNIGQRFVQSQDSVDGSRVAQLGGWTRAPAPVGHRRHRFGSGEDGGEYVRRSCLAKSLWRPFCRLHF
jgi:hypothetical protein